MLDLIVSKNGLAAIAICIGIYSYIPYFIGIFIGHNKPHGFSWFVWGIVTAIGWAAQVSENAGPGAWITGLTAFACLAIAALSLKYGERSVTRSDWLTFIGALTAIPLWAVTKDPLYAVLLISLIDTLALYPTLRKTWVKPHEEVLVTHGLSSVKFALSLLALENVNFVTVFYPAVVVVLGVVFVTVTLLRRKTLNVRTA